MLLSPSLFPFTLRYAYTDSEIRSGPKINCSCVCMLRRHKAGFNLGTLYHHRQQHRNQIIQEKYNYKNNTSSRLVFATKTSQSSVMADKDDVMTEATKQQTPTAEKEKKKELPPPPEKPEAGDCCGSGCVRCIWDIYYDQLDDYNKLLNQSQSPPPPSQ